MKIDYNKYVNSKIGNITILSVYYKEFAKNKDSLTPYLVCVCDCGVQFERLAYDFFGKRQKKRGYKCKKCQLADFPKMQPIIINYKSVKEMFYYEDGHLFWTEKYISFKKDKKASRLKAVGNETTKRNFVIINRNHHLQSRLIFLWHYGWLPRMVDHEDRDATNDRIENLRAATPGQNSYNKDGKKGKSSKFKGVSKRSKYNDFAAAIMLNKKSIHLGYFKDEAKAALAYNKAAVRLFGEFAFLNIITR